MTTFSQLVDSLVLEHVRPDLRAAIEQYVNLTIRELHVNRPPLSGPVFYDANLVEAQITADVANGYVWEIPDAHLFQKIEAVRFDMYGNGREAFARERTPSSMQIESRYDKLFYRSGYTYSFIGYGGIGGVISIAYFAVPRRLRYYQTGRPCVWDIDSQAFTYATAYAGSDNLKAEARLLCTNWMLDRWEDHIAQGVRCKVYSRLGDTERARLAYSTYDGMRNDIVMTESFHPGRFGEPAGG